jgi:hypothetical protein
MHDVARMSPEACRAHVANNFGVDSLARGYEAAYRMAMKRHRAVPTAGRTDNAKPARLRDGTLNRRLVPARPGPKPVHL